ncbi:MAG: hypothetical protein EZS28_008371 [Streblomastix strix]|uniref:Uncharacterized protein n=1 Tax=Streblomastix strix TaxID=222440 RepID=A0A5J4WLZ8_9EUKA|nr:MAG: hypothetical protein EZS28_008371 [Streblomastix strix]
MPTVRKGQKRRAWQQCLPQTQKLQIPKLPGNFRDVLNDDADNYTQLDDEYMYSKGCEVYVDERSGEVTVRFRGEVKAIVKENGLYAPDTDEMLHYGFFEFEYDEKLGLWSAYKLAYAAELKHAQLQCLIQSQSQNVTFRSQKQPTKGIEPLNIMTQAAVFEVRFTVGLEGGTGLGFIILGYTEEGRIEGQHAELHVEPFARQKLFDEFIWEGANVIFPMPEVEPMLPEEKTGYARRALESSAAVVQGMAGLIHKVAQGDTYNLVGKMFTVFEASVVSVSEAQVETESRLEGTYQSPINRRFSIKDDEGKIQKNVCQIGNRWRKGLQQHVQKTIYLIKKQHLIQSHSTSANTTYTKSATSNQHHFTVKGNPSFKLEGMDIYGQQKQKQKPISPKKGQQIEAVCWESDSFDPAEDLNRAVCWEHASFDSAKDVERA